MTVLCLAYFWIDEGMHESKAEKAWKTNVVTVLLLWINFDAALMFATYIYTHVLHSPTKLALHTAAWTLIHCATQMLPGSITGYRVRPSPNSWARSSAT